MPHYLCKLRPPRTFMDDMTPDEAVLMRAHREYWTPRVETGVVVAMGPVADPAGGHGVAIIEAASTAALEAMQAGSVEAVKHGHQRRGAFGHRGVHDLPFAGSLRFQHRAGDAEGQVERTAAEIAGEVQGRRGF